MGFTRFRALWVLCAAWALVGCGDERWVGTYESTSRLNMAGPLADGRTVGDAVVDYILSTAVERSPLPFKDAVKSALHSLFHERLKQELDRGLPPEWGPDGSATQLLRASLANVDVTSHVTLEEGGTFESDVVGEERFTSIRFSDVPNLGPMDLNPRALNSEWSGDDEGDTLEIEPHPTALSYAEIIAVVSAAIFERDALEFLEAKLKDLLDCAPLIKKTFGENQEIQIDLPADQSVSIDVSFLNEACVALREKLLRESYAILFDGPIMVGGTVKLEGDDDVTHALPTQQETYRGHVKVMPEQFAPRIRVTMSAVRR